MSMFSSQWFASTGASAYLLEQSLLFNDGDSAFLNRTPSSAGNRKTWTWSGWVKLSTIGNTSIFGAAERPVASSGKFRDILFIDSSNKLNFQQRNQSATNVTNILSSATFADASAWYHIVLSVDTTQSTSTNRQRVYVNGSEITSWATNTRCSQNYDGAVNGTFEHNVGRNLTLSDAATQYYDGLMALPILVDGAALAPTAFGETDDDGFWNPIEYTGVETPASAAITYALTDSGVSGSAAVTNTYSTKSIGAADAGRTVIVGVSSNGTNIVTGMTIGGVSATELTVFTGTNNTSSVWAAAVPSGTTADIVITNAGSGAATGIAVYRALNVGSLTAYTAGGSAVADPMTATVFAPAGSAIFAAGGGYSPTSFTWTGVTEDTDLGAVASGEDKATHGSIAIATDQSVDVGCDPSSGMSEGSMAAVVLTGTSFVAGGYGTNGFELDYADSSFFGQDVSSDPAAATVTYEANYLNGTDTATYTFSSADIGAVATDRKIVVTGYSSAIPSTSTQFNSVTVGGLSMNLVVASQSAYLADTVEIWEYDDSAEALGTTADIVVTVSQSSLRCQIGVYTLNGAGNVYMTDVDDYSNDPMTGTLTIPAGGVAIASAGVNAGAQTFTWTNLTENFDATGDGTGVQFSAASDAFASVAANRIITANSSAAFDNRSASAYAAWSPVGVNHYIDNNFTTSDQLEDTPTDSADDGIGNFSTWNPNDGGGHTVGVPTEGNLQFTNAAANYKGLVSTIAFPTSGKWGVKFTITGSVSGSNDGDICIVRDQFGSPTAARSRFIATTAANYTTFGLQMAGGDIKYKFNGGSSVVHYNGAASATSDVYEFLFDADNGYFDVKENGSDFGTRLTGIPTGELYWLCADMYATGILVDFGQQGYVPSESGYSALATQNLPAPTIADGSQQFTPVLYTGTGSELAITSLDFTPDFVWIKNRDATDNHMLYDSVRGATKDLHSNTTDAETTTAQTLKSFDSAGFTLGTDVQVNTNTEDYVAWCWKAGGSASSNSEGSITTSVSANTTSGFSIISYTGNATAGATLGHGLSSAPKFILAKNRDDSVNAWAGYHVALGGTHRIFLNTTAAAQDDDGNWNDTNPSATVITLGNGEISNHTGEDFIMYAWAEVEGFSKFGSYTGNNSTNGPFIYLGFRPAFVMFKKSNAAGDWQIMSSALDTYNPAIRFLEPNTSNALGAFSGSVDLLSNGFKVATTHADINSANTFLYAAYAENPFQGADGVTQARAR